METDSQLLPEQFLWNGGVQGVIPSLLYVMCPTPVFLRILRLECLYHMSLVFEFLLLLKYSVSPIGLTTIFRQPQCYLGISAPNLKKDLHFILQSDITTVL